MREKSCTCAKICHFSGLATEKCKILLIKLVSMQFMKISVSVKICIQQSLEVRGLELRGPRRYAVLNWDQKNLRYAFFAYYCKQKTAYLKFYLKSVGFRYIQPKFYPITPRKADSSWASVTVYLLNNNICARPFEFPS